MNPVYNLSIELKYEFILILGALSSRYPSMLNNKISKSLLTNLYEVMTKELPNEKAQIDSSCTDISKLLLID